MVPEDDASSFDDFDLHPKFPPLYIPCRDLCQEPTVEKVLARERDSPGSPCIGCTAELAAIGTHTPSWTQILEDVRTILVDNHWCRGRNEAYLEDLLHERFHQIMALGYEDNPTIKAYKVAWKMEASIYERILERVCKERQPYEVVQEVKSWVESCDRKWILKMELATVSEGLAETQDSERQDPERADSKRTETETEMADSETERADSEMTDSEVTETQRDTSEEPEGENPRPEIWSSYEEMVMRTTERWANDYYLMRRRRQE
jgi:hypothetical protein